MKRAQTVAKRTLQFVVPVAILVFWSVYLWRSWQTLGQYSWRFQPAALGLAVIAGVAYWISLAYCWHQTHAAVGGKLSPAQGLRIWSLSTFARYIPGNLWHVLGRTYLCERAGESKTHALLSFTLEQILTILGAAFSFVLMMPFWSAQASHFLFLLLLLPLGLVLLHPAIFGRLANLLLATLRRPGLPSVVSYHQLLLLLTMYIAPNLFAGVSLGASLAVTASLGISRVPMMIGAFAASWIVGYISFFTPSGLGVREGALVALLAPDLGTAAATVGSLLSRLTLTLAEAVVVGFWQLRGR